MLSNLSLWQGESPKDPVVHGCLSERLSTEQRVLGRKVPMRVSVQLLLRATTTCLCVPVHRYLHAAASLCVQWCGCMAQRA